jgi:RHS repeat-associated protein
MNMVATQSITRRQSGAAIDERVAQVDANGVVTFMHNDKQHSQCAIALRATLARGVIAISDTAGNPVVRRGYGTYGETDPAQMIGTSTAGSSAHPFGYTGRRWDPDLGLYYYRARWYDPQLGTFLQTDPIGSLDYINLYSYVGLEPGNATDPTGLAGIGAAAETFFALGAGEGRNSPTVYVSGVVAFSVSRDGRIEIGFVATTSERGAGAGAGSTVGPAAFRGTVSGLANNNVTIVGGNGPAGFSASLRAPVDQNGRPTLGQPSLGNAAGNVSSRATARVNAGEAFGGAVFDTTNSQAFTISVNPVGAVRELARQATEELRKAARADPTGLRSQAARQRKN